MFEYEFHYNIQRDLDNRLIRPSNRTDELLADLRGVRDPLFREKIEAQRSAEYQFRLLKDLGKI